MVMKFSKHLVILFFVLVPVAIEGQASNITNITNSTTDDNPMGKGTLVLALLYYYNRDMTSIGGGHCGGSGGRCDINFVIQLSTKKAGDLLDFAQDNEYGFTDTVIFHERIGTGPSALTNPIKLILTKDAIAYGAVGITITANQARNGRRELLDRYQRTVVIEPPVIVEHEFLVSHQKKVDIQAARIAFAYSVRCFENYFGKTCEKYCAPQNDNTTGHYTCDILGNKVCHPKWSQPQFDCKTPSRCAINPCENGGTCVDVGEDRFQCVCRPGVLGETCQIGQVKCPLNECHNGGTCTKIDGKTSCACQKGYKGSRCQDSVKWCEAYKPCVNGGTCHDQPNGYTCNCRPGFSGPGCRTTSDPCTEGKGNPCANGGTCKKGKNGEAECNCTTAFTGKLCEIDVDECDRKPCKNNENCINTMGGYDCEPIDGDECRGVTCNAGAKCVDMKYKYYCDCTPGYSGLTCNYSLGDAYLNSLQSLGANDASMVVPTMSAFTLLVATAILLTFQPDLELAL